jgi:hypothetical protein
LQAQQAFWVGDFYEKNLSAAMRATVSDVLIEQGLSRQAAGAA